MNLKQLEYFVQVAELGSFSKAALVLDIAQPALSRQVRALETELRQQLFLRNGRGVALTEAGQRLFEHGVAIMQMMAQARDDLGATRDAAGRPGDDRAAAVDRPAIDPAADRSLQARIAGRPRLAIVEGLSTHIVEWVTTGRDRYRPGLQSGSPGRARDHAAVAGGACHWSAPRRRASAGAPSRPLPMKELSAYPLIMPERVHAMRRLLETQAMLAGVKLDIAWEVSSVPAIIDLVCAGYGHAVLTASGVAASARAGELIGAPD